MRLPGDDVEHAPYGDAGERAVEATQAEVDGVKGRGDRESCERRQAPCGRGLSEAHLPAPNPPWSSKPSLLILCGFS